MRHLVLLIVSLLSVSAHALTNVDLYRAEIVIDQEKDNGDAAARVAGMKEVIIRASGDRTAIENEVIKKALSQHSQYLSKISYDQVNEQSTIRMGFNAPQIRGLLSQAQVPFWPESRSNLLVWLVEDSNFERNISWEHSSTAVLNEIKSEAQRRGLPITLPIGDFDDITGISIADVWGGFVEPISTASQRYPSDAVLVVRSQGNNLRWTLYDQKPSSMMSRTQAPITGTESGSQSAADMINTVSDYYANKNAVMVASESSESVIAQFTSIDSALDFFQLENNLKALSSVASLDIVKIQGTTVTFNVHLLASQAEFEQEVLRIQGINKATETFPPSELNAPDNLDHSGSENSAADTDVVGEPVIVEAAATASELNTPVESSMEIQSHDSTEAVRTLRFEWKTD
ncbi:DUF2066 domain-containing protein [Vibrio genomosp. F10]|uniref:DUF2066 domain-containing protein n=3 Tax=Vibrio genomosp. F10 TaxID=723171 RepID=A0A1B9QZ50_9VIBR|nr:DUF2066 domain-containing protein [Vibrio genomosp. F10]OCH76306.1 hypothetical protein A6E14_01525 [Vibrio genomosp. F10]OEE33997.1 hypothetical protein A1QO_08720 [Vibrio genomosp. F10 str. ZF-129]OEE97903.1 hypothetical protein A1QM_13380 [Vibrio genomosp. F10 str. 9ZC157]OEF09030.1 hypothetical protein A1QI_15605 [Vibrio genomosp. F10 str. 9ZB36]